MTSLSFIGFSQPQTKKHTVADTTKDSNKIFKAIDNPPEFPGGLSSLTKYLSANIKYPIDARENGVEGRVLVKFVVCTDGSLCNETIENSVMPSIDSEVLRVVQAMPNWKPGKQNGEAVKVYYTLPVSFKLDDGDEKSALDSFMNSDANKPSQVFTAVEQMPEFNGGTEQCNKFIKENLKYPEDAVAMQVQSSVVMKFIVDETGRILFPKVEKSVCNTCDIEAIRVINSMPKWKPGKQNGKAVKVLYTLPLTFKLSSK